MRASIGRGRARRTITPSEFDKEVSAVLFGLVRAEAIEVSKPILTRMAARLKTAALDEAYQLLQYAYAILLRTSSKSVEQFSGADIAPSNSRGSLSQGLTGALTSGGINWEPLAANTVRDKKKHFPRNKDRILVRTGALATYLLQSSKSVVENRFGGIEVNVDDAARGLDRTRQLRFSEGDRNYKTILGTIKLRIFPRIAPSLLPGLASRRWTDLGGTWGAMERATLPPGVSKKLAPEGSGARLPYRPLILPLTQFWMLVRIPNAVGLALQKFAKTITP